MSHNQGGQSVVFSCKSGRLYQERQGRQGVRIWSGISIGADKGQFPVCFGIDFSSNAGQILTCTPAGRACRTIRRRDFGIGQYRQGILVSEKPSPFRSRWHQRERASASCEHQEQKTPASTRCPRKAQAPPGRDRAVDWTSQTWRTIRSEQNEIRCNNIGRGVFLCAWIQFTPIEPTSDGESGTGSMIAKRCVLCFEVTTEISGGILRSLRLPQDS